MAAANRPSLRQVKTEWGLNRCIGLTPWRPVSVPHRIGGPIWLTTGKRPNPGILPAHKPKGRTGCFLIGDVVEGIAPQTGQVAKEYYAYSKHGSCVVMGAVAPHLGHRLLAVYEQRTKKEYTHFMQQIAATYPKAVKIRLVQDNLNTHSISAFYSCLPAAEAAALAARFEFYYTPKCGSWLNMIEPGGRSH